ncbi:MAG TPA: DUF559 domain-containing protein [Bacillota bacterium]|nr:DUF559 domain-containing protein [Bacillota bacterium]
MRGIVRDQLVKEIKLERTKEFRLHMTEAEAILWERLRKNKLNGLHFRRQQIINGFIVDFYCNAASVVIEVDGEVHDKQKAGDALRDRLMNEMGLFVLRVTNEAIHHNLPAVLQRIAQICQDRL